MHNWQSITIHTHLYQDYGSKNKIGSILTDNSEWSVNSCVMGVFQSEILLLFIQKIMTEFKTSIYGPVRTAHTPVRVIYCTLRKVQKILRFWRDVRKYVSKF